MMGSRGEPSPQVATLAAVLEIADLLRNADKTMPKAVEELRAAAAEAKAARTELDETTTEHLKLAADLEVRRQDLETAQAAVTAHEAACKAHDVEFVRHKAILADQTAALTQRSRELDRQESIIGGDRDALKAATLLHTTEYEAKAKALVEETDRQHAESEAAIHAARNDAATLIRRQRSIADAEIAAQEQALHERELRLAGREKALHEHAVQIRAALGEDQ